MSMIKRTDLSGLETLALAQGGYFDRRDAQEHEIGDDLLSYHVGTGRFERTSPGIFRLTLAPIARHDDLLFAWVWSNYRATISHESALALYELSDVMPGRVQITVPPTFGRQTDLFDLHWASLREEEVTTYDGLPTTVPARSIVDAASAGTGPEQIEQAIQQAIERALATPSQIRAAALRPHYRHRRSVLPLIEATLSHAPA
jgi:predicted transcriptional regulator of viral defense system